MTDAHKLTRRTALGGAAAIGAGAILGRSGPAAAATAPATSEPTFSHAVGALAPGQTVTVTTARTFVLAGIEWRAPARPGVKLRARLPDGDWGPWAAAAVTGHDADGREGRGADDSADGRFGEPLWTGVADALQLRADTRVEGVVVHLVASPVAGDGVDAERGAGAGAAGLKLAAPVLQAGGGQPQIIARSAWAGTDLEPTAGPFYGEIKLGFVHHTVNPNSYSPGEVPGMLRAIYSFHVHTRGYFDIGYNFVIDHFGRIWEARAGGIDLQVIGAQAGGYNAESFGVSMLGTYEVVVPPPAAIRSLQRLLAWKLSLHGLPTVGEVQVVVAPSGAKYTLFKPGQQITLPRVAGHRQGDATGCPGDALFARLPAIRSQVERLAGKRSEIALTVSSTQVHAGTGVTVNGMLTVDGRAPAAPATVELQRVGPSHGPRVVDTLATLHTGAGGRISTQLPPLDHTHVLRALHLGPPATVSDIVAVEVAPVLTLKLSGAGDRGGRVHMTGTVTPAKARVTIDVYRAGGHGHGRRPVSQIRADAGDGTFRATLRFGAKQPRGEYVVIARTQADQLNGAGASPPVRLSL